MTVLMPPNATALERAVDATVATRFPLPTDLISATWNPDTCPTDLLGYLAAAYSIDLWFDDWPEARKRQVIRDAYDLHRKKTTLAGIKAHVALVDAEVVKVVRPPSKLFLRGGMTAEQREAWLQSLPQLRLYTFQQREAASTSVFAAGATGKRWLVRCYPRSSRGPEHSGRRATYWENGVETEIAFEQVGIDVVRLAVPRPSTRRFLGHGYLRHFYAQASAAPANVYNLRVSGDLGGFAVAAGLTPVSIEPTRVEATRVASRAQAFLGNMLGRRYLCASKGAQSVYDRVSLSDRTRTAAHHSGRVFLGHARLGYIPYQAELLVSVPRHRSPLRQLRYGRGYLRNTDNTTLERAIEAIRVSKAARDTILIDTETHRRVRFSGGLRFGQFRFGEYRKVY
ncbi:phage tail protein I [Sphingomonas sp. PR090111-T3T-6A]|uniref:phage tail protein I n=1 Tax=Sphingomonas sp. PR090111-T3T-6A TaxID=685778 RepID=UPI00035E9C97|nr:phage tail protein I [Sphingomonas sp. PR090111-T3T-6A]